ncbi:hypothetical protein BT63DRAFT_478197 [Microthyrium microscopicum]|uniref:F-box domain-containing protein n=1 Tax=Microthyrium microscopicum TaxID=703497 RepID=A0A6A6UEB9_9PEZI|nr:hypothetical protein BT63DRAFT_478197 [Microthyrium microscopicum]
MLRSHRVQGGATVTGTSVRSEIFAFCFCVLFFKSSYPPLQLPLSFILSFHQSQKSNLPTTKLSRPCLPQALHISSRNQRMSSSTSSSPFNLLGLPRELQDTVINYMTTKTKLQMRQTCKAFHWRIPFPTNKAILASDTLFSDPDPIHYCHGCRYFKDYRAFIFAKHYRFLDTTKWHSTEEPPNNDYLIPESAIALWTPVLARLAKLQYDNWFLYEKSTCGLCDRCCDSRYFGLPEVIRSHIEFVANALVNAIRFKDDICVAIPNLANSSATTGLGELLSRMRKIGRGARNGKTSLYKVLPPSVMLIERHLWTEEATAIVMDIFGPKKI